MKDLNINEKDPSQAKTPVQDNTFELCNNILRGRARVGTKLIWQFMTMIDNKMHPTNLCILVTRPDPEGRELSKLLQASGHLAIQFPTIAIEPAEQDEAYTKTLSKLGQQDWLIFISPQSVYASVPTIRRVWPIFPPQVKFAAVGESTARALEKAGYFSLYPADVWSSEGLLALPEFQQIHNQHITIIRGEGGRELLEQKLIERGANVSSLISYRRVLPPITNLEPYLLLLKERKVDVIICTSGESVNNLKKLTGDENFRMLKQVPLLVVSDRIKMLAQDLGFQTIWVANNAKHETLIRALNEIRTQ